MELHPEDRVNGIPGGDFPYWLNRYAAVFKDAGFSEEREWRLISKPVYVKNPAYGFREGRSNLIPYYKLPITTSAGEVKISEILLGPTPHGELAASAVTDFLQGQNFTQSTYAGLQFHSETGKPISGAMRYRFGFVPSGGRGEVGFGAGGTLCPPVSLVFPGAGDGCGLCCGGAGPFLPWLIANFSVSSPLFLLCLRSRRRRRDVVFPLDAQAGGVYGTTR